MKKLNYSCYETDVDNAHASSMQANDSLSTEIARQGSRRVADGVARWWREIMKVKVDVQLPDSLQKVLEEEAPD